MHKTSPRSGIRSKSMSSLHDADMEELSTALEKFHYEQGRSQLLNEATSSESSVKISIVDDSDTTRDSDVDVDNATAGAKLSEDSGFCDRRCRDFELLMLLEKKIDILGDLFVEQSVLLSSLKQDMSHFKVTAEQVGHDHGRVASELINHALVQRFKCVQADDTAAVAAGGSTATGLEAAYTVNSRAKALLDALEYKQKAASIDAIIKTTLTDFLQSDDLREHMVAATMDSIKTVITKCVSKEMFSSYLPLLEKSHRKLLNQVSRTLDETFREMEANMASYARCSRQTTRTVRVALERHQRLLNEYTTPGDNTVDALQKTVHQILQKELAQWREKVLDVLVEQQANVESSASNESLEYIPSSPPQPAQPGRSAIEQLMKAAEINAQMKDGDVNGSFESALTALDLSLVMAACRAADPAVIFAAPCQLKQHVLLSLVQQLTTDMVHDNQLKCSYLEHAIINLDIKDPTTGQHLPLVVGEVCSRLSSFLTTYPSHMSSRRIKMIIMAAGSLLKNIEKL